VFSIVEGRGGFNRKGIRELLDGIRLKRRMKRDRC
jgi:hypothetical protein